MTCPVRNCRQNAVRPGRQRWTSPGQGTAGKKDHMAENIVRKLRNGRGWTLKQLAEAAGGVVTLQAISAWETGAVPNPSRAHVAAIDAALDAGGEVLAFYGFTPLGSDGIAELLAEVLSRFEALQDRVDRLTRRLDELERPAVPPVR